MYVVPTFAIRIRYCEDYYAFQYGNKCYNSNRHQKHLTLRHQFALIVDQLASSYRLVHYGNRCFHFFVLPIQHCLLEKYGIRSVYEIAVERKFIAYLNKNLKNITWTYRGHLFVLNFLVYNAKLSLFFHSW